METRAAKRKRQEISNKDRIMNNEGNENGNEKSANSCQKVNADIFEIVVHIFLLCH